MGQLVLIGIGGGLVGTLMLSRVLSRFLYGVSAFDPRVTASVAGIIALAGFGAALMPARRASTVDPMRVLRAE
jgi:putative ABC transport system permease protein